MIRGEGCNGLAGEGTFFASSEAPGTFALQFRSQCSKEYDGVLHELDEIEKKVKRIPTARRLEQRR